MTMGCVLLLKLGLYNSWLKVYGGMKIFLRPCVCLVTVVAQAVQALGLLIGGLGVHAPAPLSCHFWALKPMPIQNHSANASPKGWMRKEESWPPEKHHCYTVNTTTHPLA